MPNIPVIKDGVVVNVVVVEEGAHWAPPKGCVLGPAGGNMGDLFDGTAYSRPPEPPEPTPFTSPSRTAEQKLLAAGLTVDELKTLLGIQ